MLGGGDAGRMSSWGNVATKHIPICPLMDLPLKELVTAVFKKTHETYFSLGWTLPIHTAVQDCEHYTSDFFLQQASKQDWWRRGKREITSSSLCTTFPRIWINKLQCLTRHLESWCLLPCTKGRVGRQISKYPSCIIFSSNYTCLDYELSFQLSWWWQLISTCFNGLR